jgi:hypothetical protein
VIPADRKPGVALEQRTARQRRVDAHFAKLARGDLRAADFRDGFGRLLAALEALEAGDVATAARAIEWSLGLLSAAAPEWERRAAALLELEAELARLQQVEAEAVRLSGGVLELDRAARSDVAGRQRS